MSDLEKGRAQRESLDAAASAVPSSRRSDIWNGMMRYLSGEARRDRSRPDDSEGPSAPRTKPPTTD